MDVSKGLNVCLHICMSVCVCFFLYVCMYVCMYVSVFVKLCLRRCVYPVYHPRIVTNNKNGGGIRDNSTKPTTPSLHTIKIPHLVAMGERIDTIISRVNIHVQFRTFTHTSKFTEQSEAVL